MRASARIYGIRFAAFAPLRMPWANLMNFAATVEGLRQYFGARLRRDVPVWIKTEHIYPAQTGGIG